MDRRRQAEKNKMTVQECIYPSTVTGDVVTRRDDDIAGKKETLRNCGNLKHEMQFGVCFMLRVEME